MKDSSNTNKSQDRAAPVGARDEDSTLFSLAALKRKEAESPKQVTRKEDSGLIDLRALAKLEAPPPTKDAASPLMPSTDIFGAVPGTLAAPTVTGASPGIEPIPLAAQKRHTGLIIAGAVAAVGIAGAVFAATRGGGAERTGAVASVTATAPAAPTVTATAPPAEPEPTVAALTPGQRPAGPTATTTAPPAPVARAPGPMPKPKQTAAADNPPPPKPAEVCDLACQMQRAVSKKK